MRLRQSQRAGGTKILNKPCLYTSCNGDEGLCSMRRGQKRGLAAECIGLERQAAQQRAGSGVWVRMLDPKTAFYAEITYSSSTKVDFTPAVVSALLAGTSVVYMMGGPRHHAARLCPIQPKGQPN